MLRLCARGIKGGIRAHSAVRWPHRVPIMRYQCYREFSSPSPWGPDPDSGKKSSSKSTGAQIQAFVNSATKGVVTLSRSTLNFFLHPALIPKKLNYAWGEIKDVFHHYWVNSV